MAFELELENEYMPKIKVIGVGGGGGLHDLAGRELDELALGDCGTGRERGLAVGSDCFHLVLPFLLLT